MDEGLKAVLEEKGVWYRFIEKAETVHTVDAAVAAGVELSRLTKTLVLLDEDGAPCVAIVPGGGKLSFIKARAAFGVKKLRLVPFDKAEAYSGYLPGATPMVCHKTRMPVVMDASLAALPTILGGGGTRTSLLELRTEDVVRLNGAKVADITERALA